MKKSWKTTASGVAGVVIIIASAVQALFDDNVLTNPDWEVVITALVTSFGLIFARDNKVTSEDVGAKKNEP